MQPPDDRDLALERALCMAVRHLERAADGGWRLVVANGTLTTLRARVIDEDWLAVTAPSATPAASWWPLLQRNARVDGCARLARAPGGALEVRGEIFIGAEAGVEGRQDEELVERVAALCDDVASAGHEVRDAGRDDRDDAADATPGSASNADHLVRLCHEAGWSATSHTSGEVHVPLDTRTTAFQATLALANGSRLRAVVPLSEVSGVAGASQDAIAFLLLDAGAHVRTVKGVAVRQGSVDRAALAIAGERLPTSAARLDRALAALTVACDTVGREAQALQDPRLARDYLALRRPHWPESHSPLPYSYSHALEDTPCLQLP